MKTIWEYLAVNFDYVGRGFTQEFGTLYINGQRLAAWTSEAGQTAKTLPDFLRLSGEDGWELVTHNMNPFVWGLGQLHHLYFKRPKR